MTRGVGVKKPENINCNVERFVKIIAYERGRTWTENAPRFLLMSVSSRPTAFVRKKPSNITANVVVPKAKPSSAQVVVGIICTRRPNASHIHLLLFLLLTVSLHFSSETTLVVNHDIHDSR